MMQFSINYSICNRNNTGGAVVQRFVDENGIENGVEPIGVPGRYVEYRGAHYAETAVGTFYVGPFENDVDEVLAFMRGKTDVLNLVVNTAAEAGGQGAGEHAKLHWIAVRVERYSDGALHTFYMDSLNGADSYTGLLQGLKNLLGG